MLRWLSGAPVPDEGLLSFLPLGEVLEGRLDTLGAFRDNPPGLALLAQVLGSGRLLGQVLGQVPDELATIADPHRVPAPKDRSRLSREAIASLEWRGPDKVLPGLRRFKRREMMHISIGDVAGDIGPHAVGASLADLADACLEAALQGAEPSLAVIGMGKLGGRELSYSSDIDVMFVHEGDPRSAEASAEELLRTIGEVTPEGQAFRIDPNLRPEGRSGALTRSLDSFREYYERWGRPWEFQALLKARASAGSADVAARFVEMVRPLAHPPTLPREWLSEIRHLKARMEKERIPRGTDPRRHTKLGPGGLSDIEFSVQVLQLQHAHAHQALQTTNTAAALAGACEVGLLSEAETARLQEALSFLMHLRNRMFFLYARPVDALPLKPEELEALGIAMGFKDQPRQEVEETYLRNTRRARTICERVIFGNA